jgi:polar amino acid transport system substrate-binding protein
MGIFAFAQSKPVELIFVSEDKENFPQQMGTSTEYDMKKPGVAVEFLKQLEPILNIKIIFRRMPWKKCLEEDLKNGNADGAFLASYNKEREEFGVYPMKEGKPDVDKRVTTTNYIFCKVKGSAVDWDGKNPLNLKAGGFIGAPLGYSIVGDLKNMGLTVIESEDSKSGLKQLVNGRIELFACLDSQADYNIKMMSELKNKIEIIKTPITSKPYYLMLSKQFVEKNSVLADKIWNNIKALREKTYTKIEAKYFK